MPASPYTDTCLWRACSGDSFRFVNWGDDCIVYHRPSGTTHLLNTSSLSLVRDMLREPQTTEQVAARFCSRDVSEAEFGRVEHELRLVLEQLEHIGLVERL